MLGRRHVVRVLFNSHPHVVLFPSIHITYFIPGPQLHTAYTGIIGRVDGEYHHRSQQQQPYVAAAAG